jgi:predicted enzyme related to lactoylglutathione lyase
MPSGHQLVSLIPVRKMDRAIGFYTKALGGKLGDRAPGKMKDFWATMKLGGAEVWFVTPSKREKRKLAYHTFIVKDIRKFVANLKQRGVKFEKPERMSKETTIEGPIAFEMVGASAFFKDSEGNLLMVWQNLSPM